MLRRIHKAMANRESGTTIAELGVVVIIIGLLALIAIPIMMGQRGKGVDAGLKSDLQTTGAAMGSWFVDNPLGGSATDYSTNAAMATFIGSYGYRTSGTNYVWMRYNGGDSYCVFAFADSSKDHKTLATSLIYDSKLGGVIERAAVTASGACAGP